MTTKLKAMTVKRLKDFIADVPDDYIVWAEGCDCTEEAYGVLIDHDDKTVEVIRENTATSMAMQEEETEQ